MTSTYTHRPVLSYFCLLVSFAVPVFAAPQASSDNIPNIGFQTTPVEIRQPDPRHNGWLLWKLNIHGFEGQLLQTNQYEIHVRGVNGILYNKGVQSAQFTAPHAVGNSLAQTLDATGRVKIKSLTQIGTNLTADRVIWYAKKDLIVATGHVVMHYGKTGATLTAPYVATDSKLRAFTSDQGTHFRFPKGL